MSRKKSFRLAAFSLPVLFLFLSAAPQAADAHPALALMRLRQGDIRLPAVVNPYLANLIALDALADGKHISLVRDYILWYLSHLNYPDRHGLTGTIYDYEVQGVSSERSTFVYDSVDGYAGTFLCLLDRYAGRTNDRKLIEDAWQKILDVAYVIVYLQHPDGLTIALPSDPDRTRYLMDNCESYGGLMALERLAKLIGRKLPPVYARKAVVLRNSILTILYDPQRGNFHWAIDDRRQYPSDESVLYPDALAQLFPIFFNLADCEQAQRLWRRFNLHHLDKIDRLPPEQKIIYRWTQEKMHP